jgi:hypothetical protein
MTTFFLTMEPVTVSLCMAKGCCEDWVKDLGTWRLSLLSGGVKNLRNREPFLSIVRGEI